MTESEDLPRPERKRTDVRLRIAVVIVVLAAFALIVVVKTGGTASPATCPAPVADSSAPSPANPPAQPSDAVAAYEAALKAGKPIYVMFHSTTCAPCIEIAGVADGVIPDYADKITFVDAVTDDPSAQELASRFSFQYIPTSFFLEADGTVVDSFTGAMDEAKMRGYLDAMVAAQ